MAEQPTASTTAAVKTAVVNAAISLKNVLINYKWYFIVAIVVITITSGSFVGGCFYGEHKITKGVSSEKQEIPKKGKGKDGYVPPKPTNCDEYKTCADSPITTTFTLKSRTAYIHASNKCRYRDDEYSIPVLYFTNTIEFNPGIGAGGMSGRVYPIVGGSIFYIYHYNPSFGFGGGPFYFTSLDKTLWNAGAQLSLQYSW